MSKATCPICTLEVRGDQSTVKRMVQGRLREVHLDCHRPPVPKRPELSDFVKFMKEKRHWIGP